MTQCMSRASQPDLGQAPRLLCTEGPRSQDARASRWGSRARQASGRPPSPQVPTMSGQTAAYFLKPKAHKRSIPRLSSVDNTPT